MQDKKTTTKKPSTRKQPAGKPKTTTKAKTTTKKPEEKRKGGRPRIHPAPKPRPKEAKELGRPTDYREEYNEQAYKLCLLGMVDKELAKFFGVSEKTLNTWKKEFPEFLQSLAAGKEIANAEVAHSLYKRAVGFERPDAVKIFMPANAKKPVYAKFTEYYPPDASAAFRFLLNREPEKWRDKREVKLEGMPQIGVLLDLPEDEGSDDENKE